VNSIFVPEHVQNFLNRLDGVSRSGMGWAAKCPCRNDDENPSLTVGVGRNDQVLIKCHNGNPCSVEQIVRYMNLEMKDLYQDKVLPVSVSSKKDRGKRKVEAVYQYVDDNFEVLYEKVKYRYEDGGKGFSQRRPDPALPGKYIYSLIPKEQRVLYNLPVIKKAIEDKEPIWLVEGEKDVDTLEKHNIIATTAGGAGTWEPQFTDILADAAAVVIVADNDEAGKAHAIGVQRILQGAGCANVSVFVSNYAKDITDHVNSGHAVNDLVELDYQPAENVTESLTAEVLAENRILEQIIEIFGRSIRTDQKVSRTRALLDGFGILEIGDHGRLVEWETFLEETDKDTYEWVIPGLIEKQERVIIVAAEGVGKTMLARQVAILSSVGVHPFTFQPMAPIRTLTIDLENPERIIRRTSRWIMKRAQQFARDRAARGTAIRSDAHLMIKPSGMDLMTPSGRSLFEQTVDEVRPQLLCVGPLYKSYADTGTLTSEALAVEVAKFFDYIRDVYDCALWLEHHAPLGQSSTSRELRPFGSAVWSRWPEFGLALSPNQTSGTEYVYDVRHFRGARDRRPWPSKMKRGVQFPFETLEFMKADIEEKRPDSGEVF
jgi:5S rRNA maturation endonuclease (ribonuclease M5)